MFVLYIIKVSGGNKLVYDEWVLRENLLCDKFIWIYFIWSK